VGVGGQYLTFMMKNEVQSITKPSSPMPPRAQPSTWGSVHREGVQRMHKGLQYRVGLPQYMNIGSLRRLYSTSQACTVQNRTAQCNESTLQWNKEQRSALQLRTSQTVASSPGCPALGLSFSSPLRYRNTEKSAYTRKNTEMRAASLTAMPMML
jgi:hypothetical protein